MRKPVSVPASLILCTTSVCLEQRDVEAAGKRGEQRGPFPAMSLLGLSMPCPTAVGKKVGAEKFPHCHPNISREKLSMKCWHIFHHP